MFGRDRMRYNPPAVMAGGEFFLVDRFTGLDHGTIDGCRVNIREYEDRGVNRWELTRMKDAHGADVGLDFYFPYVHGHSVGRVKVSDPSDGTIVTTAQMNGCALEVRLNPDGSYSFYHDTNGRQMGTVRDGGTTICRIEGDAYMDDNYAAGLTKGDRIPLVQFICVYKNKQWHVGSFGILVNPDSTKLQYEIKGAFIPRGGCYRGYFTRTTHLIQTS